MAIRSMPPWPGCLSWRQHLKSGDKESVDVRSGAKASGDTSTAAATAMQLRVNIRQRRWDKYAHMVASIEANQRFRMLAVCGSC